MFWQYLIVFLISMVPLIELRGAIPVSQAMGLNLVASFVISIIGNIIVVPIIFFFAQKVLNWGAKWKIKWFRKFCKWCLKKGHKGGEKLLEKTRGGVYVALLLFVGIPVPGTGAWTGTLAASLLNLDAKKSFVAITLGVLLAGVIMSVVSYGLFGLF